MSLGPPGILLSRAHPWLKAPQAFKVQSILLFPCSYVLWSHRKSRDNEYWAIASEGRYGVRWLPVSGHKTRSISWYITLFYVFFKDTLVNIYCWFMNTELTATTLLTHARPEFISHTDFPPKAHPGSVHLRTSSSTLELCLGTTLNSNTTNKKHKFQKSRPWLDYENDSHLQ